VKTRLRKSCEEDGTVGWQDETSGVIGRLWSSSSNEFRQWCVYARKSLDADAGSALPVNLMFRSTLRIQEQIGCEAMTAQKAFVSIQLSLHTKLIQLI
jgi:hypothetical protein